MTAKLPMTQRTNLSSLHGLWVKTCDSDLAPIDLDLVSVSPTDSTDHLSELLVDFISGAREVVILSAFIIAHRSLEVALKEASDRGVRVYILTASEKRLERDPNNEVEAARLQDHRRLLNNLAGHALLRSAPGFHAKLLLRDPHTSPEGILSTANLVHSDLQWNDEAVIRLTSDETRECFAVLRWAFWEASEHELLEPGTLRAISPLHKVDWAEPSNRIRANTMHGRGIDQLLVGLIDTHDRCVLTNYGFALNHSVVKSLLAAAQAGKDVTVVARVSKKTHRSSPTLLRLRDAGVRVLGTDRMHAKLASFGGGTAAVVHTQNFTINSDSSSLELGVHLTDSRAREVERLLGHWHSSAPWRLHDRFPEDSGAVRVVHVGSGAWEELGSRP